MSGLFERFLIERGERVRSDPDAVDGPTCRRGGPPAREVRLRSHAIAVALAALREGLERLPAAQLEGPRAPTCGCWSTTASAWSGFAPPSTPICSGTCTTSGPSRSSPSSACCRRNGRPGDGAAPGSSRADPRVRIARDDSRIRELTDHRGTRSRDRRPGHPGRTPPTRRTRLRAADRGQALGEIAGAAASPATPSSPARAGSRRSRSARARPTATAWTAAATARSTPRIHRIAITRATCHPETHGDYIARKRAEGKTTKEAIRCLKRHLARRIWHLLSDAAPPSQGHPDRRLLDIGAAKAIARFTAGELHAAGCVRRQLSATILGSRLIGEHSARLGNCSHPRPNPPGQTDKSPDPPGRRPVCELSKRVEQGERAASSGAAHGAMSFVHRQQRVPHQAARVVGSQGLLLARGTMLGSLR